MLPRLHLTTDDGVLADPSFVAHARNVLEAAGGHAALHLRGHGTAAAALYGLARALAPAARAASAPLLVNDRVDIAMALRRAFPGLVVGAQLGRRSLTVADARRLLGGAAWIGYSAHAPDEAASAAAEGADFVVIGSVYATASHPDREAAGIGLVGETAATVSVPVLAIGGVAPDHVPELLAAGAYGIAVLGGVWRRPDPAAAATRYLAALEAEKSGASGV